MGLKNDSDFCSFITSPGRSRTERILLPNSWASLLWSLCSVTTIISSYLNACRISLKRANISNPGFPRNISTPTTPTPKIAQIPTLCAVSITDLRGVFTPMFSLVASFNDPAYLIIPSIHSNLFMNESSPPLESFHRECQYLICATFFPIALFAWDLFGCPQKVQNCGKETTSL